MISTGRSRHSDGIPVLTGSPTSNKVDIPVTLRFYNAILLNNPIDWKYSSGKKIGNND
ncbi:hypothetical protein [Flavobacterium sp.]|uniref:hypothetical protein n=1 Tax=Flavobacterium sp. TaxID=239 RepID=UPI003526C810